MNSMQQFTRALLLSSYLLLGCAAPPGPQLEGSYFGPAKPTFLFQNLSHERVAVYLVEDTRESLLGLVDPLQSARLPLPDRIYTSEGRMISLAIMTRRARTLQPSQENGAILSTRRRGTSLIGQTWAFSGGQLLEPVIVFRPNVPVAPRDPALVVSQDPPRLEP